MNFTSGDGTAWAVESSLRAYMARAEQDNTMDPGQRLEVAALYPYMQHVAERLSELGYLTGSGNSAVVSDSGWDSFFQDDEHKTLLRGLGVSL